MSGMLSNVVVVVDVEAVVDGADVVVVVDVAVVVTVVEDDEVERGTTSVDAVAVDVDSKVADGSVVDCVQPAPARNRPSTTQPTLPRFIGTSRRVSHEACHLYKARTTVSPTLGPKHPPTSAETSNNPKGWCPRGCWCRRGDSNPHRSYPTWPSTMRVYQFRHSDVATGSIGTPKTNRVRR